MLRQLIHLVISLLVIGEVSYSQIKSVTLLKGYVLDKQSGNPIEAEFYLVYNSNRYVVKSSKDGSFQIPINTSGDYFVFSKRFLPIEPKIIPIVVENNYGEKEVKLYFEQIRSGLVISELAGFEKNTSQLNSDFRNYLNYLSQINKLNPGIFFSIEVSANDVTFKTIKRKEKIGNKTSIRTISPAEQANDLIEKRIKSIKDHLYKIKLPERNFQFISLPYSLTKIDKRKKGEKSKKKDQQTLKNNLVNIRILVHRIMDLQK